MNAIKNINYREIDFLALSKRVNAELEKNNWSYIQLAKLANTSKETIRSICIGENVNPKINTLEAIAKAFHIGIFDLLGNNHAISIIEEKSIPLYSISTIDKLKHNEMPTEKITCLVKGSNDCFALKVDHALENILINSNSMLVNIGDLLIFEKNYDAKKIKNRVIVIYNVADVPTIGEVIGVDDVNMIYISQKGCTTKNSVINSVTQKDIIALMSAIQFK